MRHATVYSDASVRDGAAGYGAVIVTDAPDVWITGALPNIGNSVAAEIAAIAAAVEQCPASDILAVYTDLDWLPDAMGGMWISYERTIRPQMEQLRAACKRHVRVEFRVVGRDNGRYRQCHQLSRKAAAKCRHDPTFIRVQQQRMKLAAELIAEDDERLARKERLKRSREKLKGGLEL